MHKSEEETVTYALTSERHSTFVPNMHRIPSFPANRIAHQYRGEGQCGAHARTRVRVTEEKGGQDCKLHFPPFHTRRAMLAARPYNQSNYCRGSSWLVGKGCLHLRSCMRTVGIPP